MIAEIVCQCEIFEDCPACRGTDRDVGLHLRTNSSSCDETADIEQVSTKELLELSRLYYNTILDLADAFDVTLTPASRAQAFQILSDLGEELKMRALTSVVLSEVEQDGD